jgi:hypothetical protein
MRDQKVTTMPRARGRATRNNGDPFLSAAPKINLPLYKPKGVCWYCSEKIGKYDSAAVYKGKRYHSRCALVLAKGDREQLYKTHADYRRARQADLPPAEKSQRPGSVLRIDPSEYAPRVEVPKPLEVAQTAPVVAADAFSPKPDSDYVAEVPARTMVKSRSHETLVRDFGEWARANGFTPSTPHPQDLVLKAHGNSWLVEAKVIYRGDCAEACRAAIGQLMDYRHFMYRQAAKPDPSLLALFSESIGDYAELLESLGIAPVWRSGDCWGGSLPSCIRGSPGAPGPGS